MNDPMRVADKKRHELNSIAEEVTKSRRQSAIGSPHQIVDNAPIRIHGLTPGDEHLTTEVEQLVNDLVDPSIQVGRMPPQPQTLRARLGGVLVRLIQRSLFWYSAQINETNGRIATTLRAQASRITNLAKRFDQNRIEFSEHHRAVESAIQQLQQHSLQSRQMLEDYAEEVRKLTTNSTATHREIAEVSVSLRSLNEDLSNTRAALPNEIRIAVEQALAEERNARLSIEGLLEEERRARVAFEGALEEERRTRAAVENAKQEAYTAAQSEIERATTSILRLERLLHQTKVAVQVQESRISMLMRERRLVGATSTETLPSPSPTAASTAELGSLYLDFENAFRGSRAEIKERVAVYLPRIAKNDIGTQAMPILDVGCGRGEWLEVLSENRLVGSGVDSNEACVSECRDRGLTVELSDGLRFLRSRPSESLGAITAFHVVEHLSFEMMIALLDEALRVLKTGGSLILETPNPANLIVGAHTFYLDPTHIRPLPADLLRFIVESRGFCSTEVVPLHPFPDHYRLDDTSNAAATLLNDLVYGARDYAVIAERP